MPTCLNSEEASTTDERREDIDFVSAIIDCHFELRY
jgi:hypothetical protein